MIEMEGIIDFDLVQTVIHLDEENLCLDKKDAR